MATANKNLSDHQLTGSREASGYKMALVVSEWNEEVTEALYSGALGTLLHLGVQRENILRINVPGSFELTLGAQWMAEREEIDAVICLGCVIRGETPHFDYICQACAYGITEVGLKYSKPVIFGVLTTDSQKQAMERAGGKYGNKGDEAAVTAIKMLNIR